MTAKNGPKTGLFGRKTGGRRKKNDIFAIVLLHFSWFSGTQVIEALELAALAGLAKKSCQKTYRRFLSFRALCHNAAMNNVNTMVHGNENTAPSGGTQTERAEDNIARDEFCRRRCCHETVLRSPPVPRVRRWGLSHSWSTLVNPGQPQSPQNDKKKLLVEQGAG